MHLGNSVDSKESPCHKDSDNRLPGSFKGEVVDVTEDNKVVLTGFCQIIMVGAQSLQVGELQCSQPCKLRF